MLLELVPTKIPSIIRHRTSCDFNSSIVTDFSLPLRQKMTAISKVSRNYDSAGRSSTERKENLHISQQIITKLLEKRREKSCPSNLHLSVKSFQLRKDGRKQNKTKQNKTKKMHETYASKHQYNKFIKRQNAVIKNHWNTDLFQPRSMLKSPAEQSEVKMRPQKHTGCWMHKSYLNETKQTYIYTLLAIFRYFLVQDKYKKTTKNILFLFLVFPFFFFFLYLLEFY